MSSLRLSEGFSYCLLLIDGKLIYQVLQVSPEATEDEIKKAFRKVSEDLLLLNTLCQNQIR